MAGLRRAHSAPVRLILALACALGAVAGGTAAISSEDVQRSPAEVIPRPQGVEECSDCEGSADPSSVFFVQRNKNRNEVHYGIRLDGECRPQGSEPVYNYWLRLKQEPPVIEPLSLFQQVGYGMRRQRVEADYVDIVLRALPERPIRIVPVREEGRCRAIAYMEIGGAKSRFERAFVFAEEGLVLPSVKYIDLYGKTSSGQPVKEHVPVD